MPTLASPASELPQHAACSVTVVQQDSTAKCVHGVSFGCVGDTGMMWVRGCRGTFRCNTRKYYARAVDAAVSVECGFPAGEPAYNCSCKESPAASAPLWHMSRYLPVVYPHIELADLAPDYTLVEVTRIAPSCKPIRDYAEGRAVGWPGDHTRYQLVRGAASPWTPLASDPERTWPYGCWFYGRARGSGVFVNVSRSLRFLDRTRAARYFGLAVPGPGDTAHAYHPGDKLWCTLALQQGYDTIQVAQSHRRGSYEIVACRGCEHDRNTGVCPPSSLPLIAAGGRECACDDASSILNCHGAPMVSCWGARHHVALLFTESCAALRRRRGTRKRHNLPASGRQHLESRTECSSTWFDF